MTPTFSVTIKTPQKIVFEGKARSLVAPGAMGFVGILANHAPFITTLASGKIAIRDDSGRLLTFRSGGAGFLEMLENNAILLLDSAEG